MDPRKPRKGYRVVIYIHFEPNHLEPISLQTAYEYLVPKRRYSIRRETSEPASQVLPDRQRRSA